MKLVLKITLGIVLGLTLLVAGCTVLIGAGASEVSKEMERTEQRSQQHGQHLAKRIAKVEHGMTRAEVIEIMGKPESSSKADYDGLGKSEILTWDAALAGRFVTVTLDDGIVNSIDKSNFGS